MRTCLITSALSIDLLIIIGVFIFGWSLLRSIWDGWDWFEVLAFSFPLGAGLITWCIFLVSWVGIPYTSETLIALYVILLVFSMGMMIIRKRRFTGRNRAASTGIMDPNEDRNKNILILGIVAVLTIVAAIFALGRSYSTWDAIAIWGIKGYGIAQEATIFGGREWGAHGLNYPLNLPLQISFFRLFEGKEVSISPDHLGHAKPPAVRRWGLSLYVGYGPEPETGRSGSIAPEPGYGPCGP